MRWVVSLGLVIVVLCSGGCATPAGAGARWTPATADAEVARAMAQTGAQGLAIAVVEQGRPVYVRAYGVRNARGEPLTRDTVMYGASLTKAAFAYMVVQLAEAGLIGLDTPIERYLAKPLPDYAGDELEDRYARWSDLKGDERWRKLTPRILLTHGSGFANFGVLEPDGKLKFHFEPGARYAYSGDGLILLQFVLEQGPGFFKGGHNDTTANTWVCVERGRRCVVLLANDVRAERAFPRLVRHVLGESGVPWDWEYGSVETPQ